MTFKELRKFVDSQSQTGLQSNQLQKLRGKPFWEWGIKEQKQRDIASNVNCCMQHIIGLPKKNGIEYPLFDYELMLLNALLIPWYLNSSPSSLTHEPGNVMHPFKEKHLWCKKSVGLVVLEFFLRFMGWLCLYNVGNTNNKSVRESWTILNAPAPIILSKIFG